jgi:hypothetical protein
MSTPQGNLGAMFIGAHWRIPLMSPPASLFLQQYFSMSTSHFHGQRTATSFEDSTPEDRGDLKRGIKDFLIAESCKPLSTQICPRCGRQMEFTEAVFWVDGEAERFTVRLPLCKCAVANVSDQASSGSFAA